MNGRPEIPTEIKRKVLVEAGHRCAIPTCRHIDVDVHHIVPWEKCQKHEYENLIALCPNCHRRVHKNEIDRKSLAIYKNNLRKAHDKYSQFEIDFLYETYLIRDNKNTGIQFPPYLILLIKRLLESGFLSRTVTQGGVYLMEMKSSPDIYRITNIGIDFIESFSKDNEKNLP
ncbi:MAG: HNH endonuclease [Magnetococcales bacterium]|nr:HNH endonuclease [Magnetococcales bacterium]